ncbi:30S ribosomal protein S10 [Candidatus Anaplasma sp. TIGMIC]|uniref:30S ribosomal protein S10 n=1 Tax=Candidatus Anaplasma sp. TIGMIC TaxID=3020713 RepID=UPI00232E9141|nr:30S ribosomal protein S10 [Candidatus Anaplasma sp. TIGMIC]MDB1135261.1 30S ribosomal protein S10 [Candidatus Anaplasma sp. TIGMIC]
MVTQKIYIELKAFDHCLLDRSARSIIMVAKRSGAKVNGPVFFPRRLAKFIVNRSTHVDKKSREQFEIRTHKRLISLPKANSTVLQALMSLQLPAGVDVRVKVVGG